MTLNYHFINVIIYTRYARNDCYFRNDSRHFFNNCENGKIYIQTVYVWYWFLSTFLIMTNSNLLCWSIIPSGFLKKKVTNRKILLKCEICLNQAYFFHVLYTIRLQTLYKKNCYKQKMKTFFLSQWNNSWINTCLIKWFLQFNRQNISKLFSKKCINKNLKNDTFYTHCAFLPKQKQKTKHEMQMIKRYVLPHWNALYFSLLLPCWLFTYWINLISK